MKQLFYTFRTLIRGKGSNIIKLISLTFGLFIGIILFARIAYEFSYNSGYKDSDRLMEIYATYSLNGITNQPFPVVMGPVPGAFSENFPDEVESATVCDNRGNNNFFVGDKRHTGVMTLADTLFFSTMGIPVTSGSEMELALPDRVLISEDFAKKAFGTTDVIGNTMMLNKSQEVTVRGTFRNVPDNNSVRPDVVLSMATFQKYNWGYFGWGGGDGFQGYVRLRKAEDLETVNNRIDAVIEKYMPFSEDRGVRYSLQNIRKSHVNNPDIKRLIMILGFLAVSILLIAAFNYILISISSLSHRAKGIGIHKCNGATSGQILKMFLWETALIIIVAVILVALLIINFKGLIHEIIEVPVESLFSLNILWVPLCVILFIFIVPGIIPGRIFSNIPVTQVFHRYSQRNSAWKRTLLFVQFAGVTFVFGLLIVVYSQYKTLMNYDLGYNVKNIAYAQLRVPNMDLAKNTLENLPMVESAAVSYMGMAEYYSGEGVLNAEGKVIFSTRFNFITPEFVPFYGIEIVEGRNIMTPDEVIVNEKYVSLMPWTDGAIGKQSSYGDKTFGTVVGVMKDFVDSSLFQEKNPVLFGYDPRWNRYISLKLKEPFQESLMALNREVETLFPTSDVMFHSFQQRVENKYLSVKRFRDSAGIAFIAILIITLMGLFGYVNDEVQRRSKEIAIRKVNGAQSWNILVLLSKEIAWVALFAVIIGAVLSYFIGKDWLSQFAATQIELSIALYLMLVLSIMFIIVASVVLKSWNIANENPVISIKNE